MKKYLLLHYGFEKPTPEIMEAWGAWFGSVADKTIDQGGFTGGPLIIECLARGDLKSLQTEAVRARRFLESLILAGE